MPQPPFANRFARTRRAPAPLVRFRAAVQSGPLPAMNVVNKLPAGAWQLINAKRRKNAEGDALGAVALSGAEVTALVARCKTGWPKKTRSPGATP